MRGNKYKFNVMNGDEEEAYTGIFGDENGVDAYTRAMQWYAKHGQWLISQGKILVFRKCLVNGEVSDEFLPPIDEIIG